MVKLIVRDTNALRDFFLSNGFHEGSRKVIYLCYNIYKVAEYKIVAKCISKNYSIIFRFMCSLYDKISTIKLILIFAKS